MLTSIIKRNPLSSFIILNYLISWTFLYPCYQIILQAEDDVFPPLALIGLIGAYGPSIAALIVTAVLDGKAGVKILLKKVLIWRVHWFWYIFILFMPIILYGSAVWFSTLFGFQLDSAHPEDGFKAFFYLILLALPFGPMGEELGWRGYMLPKLLKKMDIWRSSLLLGFVWTLWHLASFTFPGAAIPSVFEVNVWTIFLYFLYICAETLLLTYVYLKTKGSVLIAILFHASLNACSNFLLTIFPDIEHNLPHREIIYIVNFLLLAVVAGVLLCSNRGDTKHNFQNNA